jgi:hypothetical protein
MSARHRYVKVILFEPVSTNLTGGTVVGQCGDWLLVERPQAKPRAAAKKPSPAKRKTAAAPRLERATPDQVTGLAEEALRG